jgi:hypothetical protein
LIGRSKDGVRVQGEEDEGFDEEEEEERGGADEG